MFRDNSRRWLFWVILADILIVLVTITDYHLPKGEFVVGYGTLLSLLGEVSLKNEMTFGVWWAATHLMIASIICYEVSSEKGNTWYVWVFLCVIFLGLSFDEMASIHERFLNSWSIIASIFTIGVLPFLYVTFKLYRKGKWRTVVLVFLGMGLMASAAPLEYLEHHLNWSTLAGIRLGIEEGAEVFGALICLVATVRERRGAYCANSLSRVVPNPVYMNHLSLYVIVFFFIHIVVSLFTASFIDVSSRGNPAVYFPSFMFLVISSACFWKYHYIKNKSSKVWLYLSLIYFVLSFLSYYLMSPQATIGYLVLVGDISASSKIYIIYTLYVFVTLFTLYYVENMDNRYKYYTIAILLSVLLMYYVVGFRVLRYISAGLVSVLVFFVVKQELPKPEKDYSSEVFTVFCA